MELCFPLVESLCRTLQASVEAATHDALNKPIEEVVRALQEEVAGKIKLVSISIQANKGIITSLIQNIIALLPKGIEAIIPQTVETLYDQLFELDKEKRLLIVLLPFISWGSLDNVLLYMHENVPHVSLLQIRVMSARDSHLSLSATAYRLCDCTYIDTKELTFTPDIVLDLMISNYFPFIPDTLAPLSTSALGSQDVYMALLLNSLKRQVLTSGYTDVQLLDMLSAFNAVVSETRHGGDVAEYVQLLAGEDDGDPVRLAKRWALFRVLLVETIGFYQQLYSALGIQDAHDFVTQSTLKLVMREDYANVKEFVLINMRISRLTAVELETLLRDVLGKRSALFNAYYKEILNEIETQLDGVIKGEQEAKVKSPPSKRRPVTRSCKTGNTSKALEMLANGAEPNEEKKETFEDYFKKDLKLRKSYCELISHFTTHSLLKKFVPDFKTFVFFILTPNQLLIHSFDYFLSTYMLLGLIAPESLLKCRQCAGRVGKASQLNVAVLYNVLNMYEGSVIALNDLFSLFFSVVKQRYAKINMPVIRHEYEQFCIAKAELEHVGLIRPYAHSPGEVEIIRMY